jgi:hypothetical protein
MTYSPALHAFSRDPSEPYSTRAEIQNFFHDFYEWNRLRIAETKREKEGEK